MTGCSVDIHLLYPGIFIPGLENKIPAYAGMTLQKK